MTQSSDKEFHCLSITLLLPGAAALARRARRSRRASAVLAAERAAADRGRMRRRSSSFDDLLSFGGRVPPAVGGLIVALVLLSILGRRHRARRAGRCSRPAPVLGGQVWRLVTWVFVERAARTRRSTSCSAASRSTGSAATSAGRGARGASSLTYFGVAAARGARDDAPRRSSSRSSRGGVWTRRVAGALGAPHRLGEPVPRAADPAHVRAPDLGPHARSGSRSAARSSTRVFGSMHAYVPHLARAGAHGALPARRVGARPLAVAQDPPLERKARRRASHLKVVHKDGRRRGHGRWMN